MSTIEAYTYELAQLLRIRGMKEEEIKNIVLEVKYSGTDDPLVDFGTPSDYSAKFSVEKPTNRGGQLWWFGFAAGLIWAVTAVVLLSTGVWKSPVPLVVAAVPFVGCVLLGGLASAIATARKRSWQ